MSSESLLAVTAAELEERIAAMGEKRFRVAQILEHIYKRRVADPGMMSNLPAALREKFAGRFPAREVERTVSEDGTTKLLLELGDGAGIEMVLIPSLSRMTFCLSTQVGCPVGCRFCASGALGLERNLTAAEILSELFIGAAIHGDWPDNIVFMGIGEGLLNPAGLFKALDFISGSEYIGMSPRRVTVSTSGIVPGIRKLAGLGREYNLAISLHAPDDATRAKIIPEKMRYPISEIMAAADFYRETAGRMVTLEYTLLEGVNDSVQAARALAVIALKHHCKVNLIGHNPSGTGFRRPAKPVIERFLHILELEKVQATLRLEKGGDSSAACGQLRLKRKVLERK